MNHQPNASPIERYVGMDVHKHYVMVGGMNRQKEWVLRPRKVRVSSFRAWAERNLKATDAVVIESTSNAWTIYDIVVPLVGSTVVADPRQVSEIAKAKVKTDQRDIERLLRLLIADMVPEVWVPPIHVRELRSLISYRWRLNKQITMTKNRLHSVLHQHNLQAPEGGLFRDKNQDWWNDQVFSPMVAIQVEHDLIVLKQLEEHRVAINQELARLSNTDPWAAQMVYLMQIPGFGVILGLIVVSAIGDISRFPHPKKLVGYAGLGAGVHDSGEQYSGKGITKQGRKEFRWAMVEVAWRAVGAYPYWKSQFETLKKRMHPNQAIVAIARKLLVTVWQVLTKQEAYQHATDEDIAYKMLIWSWNMDEQALDGLTRQQFAKYGLLRLGVGQDITRIVRSNLPRRLAPTAEVLALKPELKSSA
jgi:transposase